MLLQELFDRLALGELSQHKFGKTGVILEKDYPTIINQINTTLTKVHTHFPLKIKEVILQQYDTLTEYRLSSQYANSNDSSLEDIKYIVDSNTNPFIDDVLKIQEAYDGEGCLQVLNDDTNTYSWFTPEFDLLQIPTPVSPNISVLTYRAKHPVIAIDADPSTTMITIPPCLEEAVQAYIASRCFVSLGNAASAGLATFYKNEYNLEINRIERNNLIQITDGDRNIKFALKGFV
jgi:hypothetical protein